MGIITIHKTKDGSNWYQWEQPINEKAELPKGIEVELKIYDSRRMVKKKVKKAIEQEQAK